MNSVALVRPAFTASHNQSVILSKAKDLALSIDEQQSPPFTISQNQFVILSFYGQKLANPNIHDTNDLAVCVMQSFYGQKLANPNIHDTNDLAVCVMQSEAKDLALSIDDWQLPRFTISQNQSVILSEAKDLALSIDEQQLPYFTASQNQPVILSKAKDLALSIDEQQLPRFTINQNQPVILSFYGQKLANPNIHDTNDLAVCVMQSKAKDLALSIDEQQSPPFTISQNQSVILSKAKDLALSIDDWLRSLFTKRPSNHERAAHTTPLRHRQQP